MKSTKKLLIANNLLITLAVLLASCNRNKFEHDASGTFEAVEVMVSAQAAGEIKCFNIREGDALEAGKMVGYIDSTQLYLQKLQLQKNRKALLVSRPNMNAQIQATREEIANAQREKKRIENLLQGDAATQKQLDDVTSYIKVLEGKLSSQMNSLNTMIGTLDEQSSSVEIQVAIVEDLLKKCRIVNPVSGTVLSKYAEAHEVAIMGRPLYKIADTKNLFLRAYIVAGQLENVKLGDNATVFIYANKDRKTYPGKIAWISNKAEFTPKTIQTKDERQNLVYAVKIAVENTDGLIKIGMYGDVDFNP